MDVWEIHPALIRFPIALLLTAIAVDGPASWRATGSLNGIVAAIVVSGVATCWLAANFGLLAFYTMPAQTHEAHHSMFWHIGAAGANGSKQAVMRDVGRSDHKSGRIDEGNSRES